MKVISVNIEGHTHLKDRILPFLKKEQPNVVCMQEVFEVDLELIASALGMSYHFAPMALVESVSIHQKDALGSWGVALFVDDVSQLDHTGFQQAYYVQSAVKEGKSLPIFFDEEDPNSMHRVVVSAQFAAGSEHAETLYDGHRCAVATTHFTWSPKGSFTEEQQQAYESLQAVLQQYPAHLLCGDFNSPREWASDNQHEEKQYAQNVFGKLATSEYVDTIPHSISTTIDGQFHKAGNLELMVDGLFVQKKLRLPNAVRIVDGVSDHKAVVAEW